MKVLFLDIDGVLNSAASARKNRTYDILIPEALAYIQSIASQGVKIVVSSTWRKGRTVKELEDILGCSVHSITPIFKTNTRRGEEIASWLSDYIFPHGIDEPVEYCILDDDSDMLEHQLPFFVKTSMMTGMEEEHYKKVCEILGIDILKPIV